MKEMTNTRKLELIDIYINFLGGTHTMRFLRPEKFKENQEFITTLRKLKEVIEFKNHTFYINRDLDQKPWATEEPEGIDIIYEQALEIEKANKRVENFANAFIKN